MSRILTVWEMGANLGHIDRMLITARALRTRGHDVRFVLRDLSRAHSRVAVDGFAMGQAPVWLPRLANPPRLGNYAAILAAAGWLDAQGLAGLICGWRDCFELARPDVLICDHAPTALLAARSMTARTGLRVWAVGNSFEVPPAAAHFPPINDTAEERARCPAYDATVLASTNQALALLGEPALARLTDLFDTPYQAIASLPELAHYDGYPAATEFAGACFLGDVGLAPAWPAGSGQRVFVYLTPGDDSFRAVMAAIKKLGLVALVHAKGLSAEAAARLGGPGIRFEAEPLQVNATMASADVVISHASLGTASAAFLAGKPQLLLPSQAEQNMVSRRLVAAGVGLAVPPGASAHDLPVLLQRLCTEPAFATAAKACAARHTGATPQQTGARLADLIEASLT